MDLSAGFEHQHFAHCESGVMATLFKYHGLPLSEPMVFGISGALCFAYLPFLKMGNLPVISYRMFPGHIVKNLPGLLGVKYFRRTYQDPDRAMAQLDEFVAAGRLVGLQTSVYYTPYFPPEMRFQFNAHNIIIVGREGDEYLVSDPVFDHLERIKAADLKKARFARGFSAPKGLAHYPLGHPQSPDLEKLIRKGIKKTVRVMLHAPLPWIGTKGINHLARRVARLGDEPDNRYTRHFVGNIVRMQEEIGTGGGGFRFMYAAFLQEAYGILHLPVLKEASEQMTAAGDAWRQFALQCVRVVKKKRSPGDIGHIARSLRRCGENEKQIYRLLKAVK